MNFTLSQLQSNKQQMRLSIFTLLLLCTALFAHSEHYGQVDLGALSSFEQHDCHLCQQNIDSPPSALKLYPVSTGITNINKSQRPIIALTPAPYILPALRAPPSFL